ncbi:uncharacterized protein LOC117118591 isoform X3 [Anneissia japonica]|uniref:uncharacterized protein LOC117118591 isoform X3 n=1 Tax=Anneissia japonica TaxID=1529436 RepID=UPI0014259072|nr:uncharacterized protein LOC117118591 isoform X3 [Anneissia japonica]
MLEDSGGDSLKTGKAGYLYHRPGGALGRLKKKRFWFVVDPLKCHLVFHKSSSEQSNPIAAVDIKDACISLLLEHTNQFLISTGGKEHILTAESHEIMMQWLKALQDTRDLFTQGKLTRHTRSWKPRNNAPGLPKHLQKWAQSKGLVTHSVSKRRNYTDKGEPLVSGSDRFNSSAKETTNTKVNAIPTVASSPDVKDGSHSSLCSTPSSLSIPRSSFSSNLSAPSLDTDDDASISLAMSTTSTDTLSLCTTSTEVSDIDIYTESGEKIDREYLLALDKEELVLRVLQMEKELRMSRKELSKIKDRESAYKQMCQQREKYIMSLDEQLSRHTGSPGGNLEAAKQRIQDSEDTCRMYQEQNVFLNNEVQKQSALRKLDKEKIHKQKRCIQALETELLQTKIDFVCMLRDSLVVTSLDTKDKSQIRLHPESQKWKRFQQVYGEAKMMCDDLVDFKTMMQEGFVDSYGFVNYPDNQPMLVQQLCNKMCTQFKSQIKEERQVLLQWEKYFETHGNQVIVTDELRTLVRRGIPSEIRGDVWTKLVLNRVKHVQHEKGNDYYISLCNRIDMASEVEKYRRQINLDLLRTMPFNIHFEKKKSDGICRLEEVLKAFCIHNPSVGYCQGMNFITSVSLLFMDEETAFWSLVAIVENCFPSNYFDISLIGAQADQSVLKELLQIKLPRLHAHLEDIGIEMCSFTLNWFLGIFYDIIPFEVMLRVWDCFLLDGLEALFRFAVGLLQMHELSLLEKDDTLSIMKDMRHLAKVTYDADTLMKIAYVDLEPFPSMSCIIEKQNHYIKILRDVYVQQQKAREEFDRQEGLQKEKQKIREACNNDLKMDCCVESSPGKLLVCRGDIREAWLGIIDAEKCTKDTLNIVLDSQIVCMTTACSDIVLLGTLSWYLYAYSIRSEDELWCLRLHDTPLSLAFHVKSRNLYAGLANGTLAVIESISDTTPMDDFYHSVGASPVKAVLYLEGMQQIWCGCGNSVSILNNNLDLMENFEVSKNPGVHINNMVVDVHGVWITIRNSSAFGLWDVKTLTCIMVFDTAMDYMWTLASQKMRELTAPRVTALLPYHDTVWVGTADGHLIIYNIHEIDPLSVLEGMVDSRDCFKSEGSEGFLSEEDHLDDSVSTKAVDVNDDGLQAKADMKRLEVHVDPHGFETSIDSRGFDASLDTRGFETSIDTRGFETSFDSRGFDTSIDSRGLEESLDSRGYEASMESVMTMDGFRYEPRRQLFDIGEESSSEQTSDSRQDVTDAFSENRNSVVIGVRKENLIINKENEITDPAIEKDLDTSESNSDGNIHPDNLLTAIEDCDHIIEECHHLKKNCTHVNEDCHQMEEDHDHMKEDHQGIIVNLYDLAASMVANNPVVPEYPCPENRSLTESDITTSDISRIPGQRDSGNVSAFSGDQKQSDVESDSARISAAHSKESCFESVSESASVTSSVTDITPVVLSVDIGGSSDLDSLSQATSGLSLDGRLPIFHLPVEQVHKQTFEKEVQTEGTLDKTYPTEFENPLESSIETNGTLCASGEFLASEEFTISGDFTSSVTLRSGAKVFRRSSFIRAPSNKSSAVSGGSNSDSKDGHSGISTSVSDVDKQSLASVDSEGDFVIVPQSSVELKVEESQYTNKYRNGRKQQNRRGKIKAKMVSSPQTVRKLLHSSSKRTRKHSVKVKKSEEEGSGSDVSKPMEKVQNMIGKISKLKRGATRKSRKYRLSQVLVEDAPVENMRISTITPVPEDPEDNKETKKVQRKSVMSMLLQGELPPSFAFSEIVVQPRFDLEVQVQHKISECPVRCLVQSSISGTQDAAVVSCAGYFGDDEAALRWTCHARENVWIQVPIEPIV